MITLTVPKEKKKKPSIDRAAFSHRIGAGVITLDQYGLKDEEKPQPILKKPRRRSDPPDPERISDPPSPTVRSRISVRFAVDENDKPKRPSLECEECNHRVTPITEKYPSCGTHLIAIVIFILGLPLLIFLPYCFMWFGRTVRRCPLCRAIIDFEDTE